MATAPPVPSAVRHDDHNSDETPHYHFQPARRLHKQDELRMKEQGWAFFRVFCAPAAGPRNFTTMGLDLKLREMSRTGQLGDQERWLVGGSMAALRFAALVTGSVTGEPVTEKLQQAFTSMVYKPGVTGDDLDNWMHGLFHIAAPRPQDILNHPTWRMAIMVTSLKPWCTKLADWKLQLVFYAYMAANVVSSAVLKTMQRRVCFYTGPHPPPFSSVNEDVQRVPLTEANFYQVLHATTCIPFVSKKCEYIEGLGEGLFYDGAMTDYNLAVHVKDPAWPALLLSSGCKGEPVLRTVWDVFSPWRTVPSFMFDYVSQLSITRAFIKQLPSQHLPDTWDFFKADFITEPPLRMKAWCEVFDASCKYLPANPLDAVCRPGYDTGPSDSTCAVAIDAVASVVRHCCVQMLPDRCIGVPQAREDGGHSNAYVAGSEVQASSSSVGGDVHASLAAVSRTLPVNVECADGDGVMQHKQGSTRRAGPGCQGEGGGPAHRMEPSGSVQVRDVEAQVPHRGGATAASPVEHAGTIGDGRVVLCSSRSGQLGQGLYGAGPVNQRLAHSRSGSVGSTTSSSSASAGNGKALGQAVPSNAAVSAV